MARPNSAAPVRPLDDGPRYARRPSDVARQAPSARHGCRAGSSPRPPARARPDPDRSQPGRCEAPPRPPATLHPALQNRVSQRTDSGRARFFTPHVHKRARLPQGRLRAHFCRPTGSGRDAPYEPRCQRGTWPDLHNATLDLLATGRVELRSSHMRTSSHPGSRARRDGLCTSAGPAETCHTPCGQTRPRSAASRHLGGSGEGPS